MITELGNIDVLVTGISGFIGSHLAARLVEEGANVHGMVRDSSDLWRISAICDRLQLHRADLTEFESLRRLVSDVKPRKIFHLAANLDVSRSVEIMTEMVDVNIGGTLNLLRALDGISYDCFVNTGTCEEYGDNPVPFTEEQTPSPVSPYSASKAATSMFCSMLYKTKGIPITTLRPFLTYGPGQDDNMLIPSLIRRTLAGESLEMTNGEQTREFNYVDDIVDGFIKAATNSGSIGETINIGNGLECKVKDVVTMVLRLMESQIKPKTGALAYRPGEAMHFYCDNTKARQILGWEPKVNLEEGLRMTIDWARRHYYPEK